jgi:hypothetical protein
MDGDTEHAGERRARVTISHGGPPRADLFPGYAISVRFEAAIDADWLDCLVRLDLDARGRSVRCVGVHLEARDDTELTARGIRQVPLGEFVRLAIAGALRPVEVRPATAEGPAHVVIPNAGPADMAEPLEVASRGPRPQRHLPDEVLREAAAIYLAAEDNPTAAVRQLHSQRPGPPARLHTTHETPKEGE